MSKGYYKEIVTTTFIGGFWPKETVVRVKKNEFRLDRRRMCVKDFRKGKGNKINSR